MQSLLFLNHIRHTGASENHQCHNFVIQVKITAETGRHREEFFFLTCLLCLKWL